MINAIAAALFPPEGPTVNPQYQSPQRTWVGLTNQEKEEIKKQANYNWDTTAGEYASKVQVLTEAKLKDKNNG